jgi:hypothetical protein
MIVRRIMKAAAAWMLAASAMATVGGISAQAAGPERDEVMPVGQRRGTSAGGRVRRGGMTRLVVVVAASLGMVVGLNSPAMAGGDFDNNQTTMIIRDSGRYVGTVEVAIWTQNRPRNDVQAKVFGPGFSGWTRSENVGSFTTYRGWVNVNRVLPVGAKICAEGFYGDSSVGLPCATIEA